MLAAIPLTAAAQASQPLHALAQKLDCDYADLLTSESLSAGDSISDWIAIAAGCSGDPVKAKAYLAALEAYVTNAYEEDGGLHNIKATEWHRISLAVLALGGDPTCFGDNGSIDLIADGTYNWSMSDSLGLQGLNGWIFALITLDAGDYEVPADAAYTRADILDQLLTAQTDEGGFSLAGGSPDVDITAMTLQALAPYYDTDIRVQGAVDRAVGWLSAQQNTDGDFTSWGAATAEGTAQTIIALCSLGIDPRTDERFCKNGTSALDGLMRYQTESGMFRHTLDGKEDVMATEQAALALIAVERLDRDGSRLYDLTNVTVYEEEEPAAQEPETAGAVIWAAAAAIIVVIGAAAVVLIRRGKKKHV